MESSNNTYQSNIANGSYTLTNVGTITASLGSGGNRIITGNVTNSGSIVVGAGTWLSTTGSGNTFNQNAGTINATGTFTVTGGLLNFNGGTAVGDVGVYNGLLSVASTVTQASTVGAFGASSVLVNNLSPSVTVWVEGRSSFGDAILNLPSSASNAGTILLESSNNTYQSNIATGSSTLTNLGTIHSSLGSGGNRIISGTLNNQGTIAVDSNDYLEITGTFYAAGGTITGPGYLYNTALYVTASPTAQATIPLEGTGDVLETDNLPNTTLWVAGNSYINQNATLTVAAGLTNDGTILLESQNNSYSDTLSTGSGTFTNDSDGTIQVVNNSGGPRTITGTLVNQGLINVDTASYLTITGNYYAAGGSITGPGYLNNTNVFVTASPASPTTILLEGTGDTLETDNLPNTTLWVQGNSFVGVATLTVATGLTNDGTILLESQNNSYSVTLSTGRGTFTNDSDGTIQVVNNSGGSRTITGTLVNKGLINVDTASYLTITGAYYAAGGSISGPGYLTNAALYVTASPTSPTTILLDGGGDVLATDNLPSTTLWVQGNAAVGSATLTVDPGLTNDGTILLESLNNSYSDTLSTGTGTFTNDADGIIQVTNGTGGGRTITGNLTNLGTVDVGAGTELVVNGTSSSATFKNESQVTVDPAGLMLVTSTYNAAGGTITGPGYVFNGTLLVTVSTTSPTTILVDGTTTLASNNLPNTTIWVQGNTTEGSATLAVDPGLTNDGTILLESQNSTYSDTISIGSGTFTNDADGTIQVTNGTGGGRTITGNLTNLGTVDVGAGTELVINGTSSTATFKNESQVTVDPAGLMLVTSTYNAAGGTITGPGYVFNGTLLVTVSTTSPTTILVDGTTTLGTNNLPNTTIWVQGNTTEGSATLAVDPGLTNDGTILLESQNSTYNDTLSIGTGTFTNDADGIIQVTNATGGGRTITGNLTNLGTVDVGAGTELVVNGTSSAATFKNESQVTVDPAGLMLVTSTYNAAGGTITGPGYVFNGTLLVTVSTTSPTTILVDGTTTLGTNNLTNTTIWVQGNTTEGSATLAVDPGLTNDGTILLESQNSTYNDTLSIGSGTFTNDADGIIQVTNATGGGRTITGNLTNLGTVDVGAGTELVVNGTSSAATFKNESQVTVDPAGLMLVTSTYNAAGGTITGPGYVFNGTLLVTVSTTSPTTILVDGTTTLGTNNLTNTTIWVQGNTTEGSATLAVDPGLTNDGTILLESQNSTYSDTLSIGSGTFTNDADGIIQVTNATGGGRTITGNLTNLGAVNVGAGTELVVNGTSSSATFKNESQVTVDPAGLMLVTSTYNAAGGTITGPGYVFNGTLLVTVSTTSPTTILVDGTTTLATDNLPNTTIWVQANSVETSATLAVDPGLTNDGTILLESQNSTYPDTLSTGSGTFTNDADGTIQVTAGTGGTRTMSGTVINAGTIDFDTTTTLGATGANLINTGLVSIAGATVTVVGSTFSNEVGGLVSGYGTFNASGLTLNDTGGTVQALGGTLDLTATGLVSAGTLGVGTWIAGPSSTLTISGVSSISTLSANVTLQGSGATFTGISSLSKITAGADLELQNATLTTSGNLDNAGTIDLAPGTLNVGGTFTQENTGAFDVGIGGTTPGSSYGQLNASQSASLNGGTQREPHQQLRPAAGK